MSKVKFSDLSKDYKSENIKEFLGVVIALENKDDVIDFFVGLLSQSEAVMLGRRIRVARMILEGKTYVEIIEGLDVSTGLIKKTDEWLNSNDMKYKRVLGKYFKRIDSDKSGLVDVEKHPLYKTVLNILGLR